MTVTCDGVPSVGEQRQVARLESRRALDGQFRIVQPEDLSARQKSRRDPAVGERGSQAVEILRVGIRKRLEEDRAERGEDRRRGANAEGECGDGREGESRRAAEGAERNADVLEKVSMPGLLTAALRVLVQLSIVSDRTRKPLTDRPSMTFGRQERGRLGRRYPLERVIDFCCVSRRVHHGGVTKGAAFFEVCLFGHGEDVLDCSPAPRADSNYEVHTLRGFHGRLSTPVPQSRHCRRRAERGRAVCERGRGGLGGH